MGDLGKKLRRNYALINTTYEKAKDEESFVRIALDMSFKELAQRLTKKESSLKSIESFNSHLSSEIESILHPFIEQQLEGYTQTLSTKKSGTEINQSEALIPFRNATPIFCGIFTYGFEFIWKEFLTVYEKMFPTNFEKVAIFDTYFDINQQLTESFRTNSFNINKHTQHCLDFYSKLLGAFIKWQNKELKRTFEQFLEEYKTKIIHKITE